ncbi:MAG: DUF6885 family protein [Gaiellaceae bacterium]
MTGASPQAAHSSPGEGGEEGTAQQRDHLCGPFCAARILAEEGVETVGGESTDQDALALLAGSTLPDPADAAAIPPGAESLAGYRHELGIVPEPEAGTSAKTLAEAVERAAGESMRCLLMHGRWGADAVERLVATVPELGTRMIANLQTGKLWSSHAPAAVLSAELFGRPTDCEPPPDWDVGHFVELAGLLRGPGGTLVAVRDTYPSLGWGGTHLQPPRRIADALNRDDGREGGLFVISKPGAAAEVEVLARELGLQLGPWDNGTKGSPL